MGDIGNNITPHLFKILQLGDVIEVRHYVVTMLENVARNAFFLTRRFR